VLNAGGDISIPRAASFRLSGRRLDQRRVGTIDNSGTIFGIATVSSWSRRQRHQPFRRFIHGNAYGVAIANASGSVDNSGTIAGRLAPCDPRGRRSITNNAGGIIRGNFDGLVIDNGSGTSAMPNDHRNGGAARLAGAAVSPTVQADYHRL